MAAAPLPRSARLPCPPSALALALSVCALLLGAAAPATAQNFLDFRQQIRPQPTTPSVAQQMQKAGGPVKDAKMLVQADVMNYDYTNHTVAAVGNVQIYYAGATLEADKVIYNQVTKRLHAEGNARLTDADGKISYGEIIDLSDDFRDGFVDSLRVETPDDTRMAAARADRAGGNVSVLQSGVYTACAPCRDDPRKPPLWQVKAARIIHNQTEKMLYFEDARIEFFGKPLAWFPYFSAPDPTVKRKTGFLMPKFTTSSVYGFGAEIPYYAALAPDYDMTFSPRLTTKQGALLQGEYRQRFDNGSLAIRGAGIYQLDPDAFKRDDGSATPGYRQWRGSIESSGKFALSPQWTWGWDAIAVTDQTFFQNYGIRTLQQQLQRQSASVITDGVTEGISQLYLSGRGDRSYFDIRSIYFQGFSEADVQSQLPVVHPVLDYQKTLGSPVFGGELGYNVNLTSLSRQSAEFDAISQTAQASGQCALATADPAAKTPANCLLRGVPGDYSRLSADVHWRRQIVDPLGQIWTPFASIRADVASVNIENQTGVSNFVTPGDTDVVRGMPTVGLEYRYPFIGVESWGTQTVEPIAQLIVRPNETQIGKLPNEDSQSLIFDDTNLFKVDKFAGWDRVEGGGRLNTGVQYTAQANRGGNFNMLFGQSYQMFGVNSFATGDTANTGLDSGLDKGASDYVARAGYQPNSIYSFISRFRFDSRDFTMHRLELEGRASFDRWNLSVLYGNYDSQPDLGFLQRREGILASGSVKLSPNWVVNAGTLYDLHADKVTQLRTGLGYIDDCFIMSLNYIVDYTYSGNVQANQAVMMQISLRTLGGTSSTH